MAENRRIIKNPPLSSSFPPENRFSLLTARSARSHTQNLLRHMRPAMVTTFSHTIAVASPLESIE
jgi:hypothetical protein